MDNIKMKYETKIEKTTNGFILTTISGSDKERFVYTEKDTNDETNRDHLIEMLYDILDFFGEHGSKHDKRRIKICYLKGDNYEKKDAESGVEFEIID